MLTFMNIMNITNIMTAIGLVWVIIGLWLVLCTASRGWKADVVFVLLWPFHAYLERNSK